MKLGGMAACKLSPLEGIPGGRLTEAMLGFPVRLSQKTKIKDGGGGVPKQVKCLPYPAGMRFGLAWSPRAHVKNWA